MTKATTALRAQATSDASMANLMEVAGFGKKLIFRQLRKIYIYILYIYIIIYI